MRKSFKLLPWFMAAGVAWSAGFAFNAYNGGLISWLRAMYENKMAMAAEVQAPKRLLIVGGSGAHYTINSALLEQELGFPVLNLALDGNLGLNVIYPLIAEQVQPGDIVLAIPEYLMLLDDDGIGERTVQFSIAIQRPGITDVPIKQFAQDAFQFGVPSLRSLIKVGNDLVHKGYIDEYYADPLTEQGDPTKTWERKSKWWAMDVSEPVTPHSLERTAQFRKEVESQGGTLILSLPIIYGSTDAQTLGNIRKTAEELGKIAPILYDEESLNVKTDSSLFADTHYHLKPEGRRLRTIELIEQLRTVLGDDFGKSVSE